MKSISIRIACLFTIIIAAGISRAGEKKIVVALIGDSTVTDHAGWGKAFAGRFNDKVTVLNFAKSGCSSKSFHDEERIPSVLKAKPDYVLIQFGHNDQPGKGEKRETDPRTTFRDYIRGYVNTFRERGARPILVTPVTRRKFDDSGKIKSTLTPYADAVRAVAAEMDVPLIDLHSASIAHHNKIGPQAGMAYNRSQGDTTHFNPKGAAAIADLILQELQSADKTLASYSVGRSR